MCASEAGGGAVDVTGTAAPVTAVSVVGGSNSVRRASELGLDGLTIRVLVNDSGGGIMPSELMPVSKTSHNLLHACCSRPPPQAITPHASIVIALYPF